MQARMKQCPLSEARMHGLLASEQVGRLATVGQDGYLYVTSVHFVFMLEKIYIHGLAAGEKLHNIAADPHVWFEVERMISLIHDDEHPCDTSTEYESVIIRGAASVLDDKDMKIAALNAIVKKYAPRHTGKAYPSNMLKMTGVIELTVQSCSGKHYPRKTD